MKVVTCHSSTEVAQKTSDFLKSIMTREKKNNYNVFFPTGRTPLELYKLLNEDKSFWAPKLTPLQIDEFVDPHRVFFEDLRRNLLSPMGLEKKCRSINPAWSDAEMKTHVESVANERIDISVLGLGPNGHVGFHEPHCQADFIGGRVFVSDGTRHRVAGATTNEVLTFGVGTFIKANHVILLATGEEKRSVYKKFLEAESVADIPATLLKKHPNFLVITDLK